MTIAVRYYTKSGNTKKLADAVAAAVNSAAQEISQPLTEQTDLLFLGASVYAGGLDPAVKTFLEQNREQIGEVALFSSSASGKSVYKSLARLARTNGFSLYEEQFGCPGHFLFLHTGRPNRHDLDSVALFARNAVEKRKARKENHEE